ncbi:threonine ammonia-lyase, biosynthetic [Batrachochytrium salamandrivorans]|nr:threonine ammonia-lyase, biosynthetic [Batrachochytrium salamandrivorans]
MTNKHSSASEIEAGASLRTSMSALLPLVWPQSSLPLKAVRNTTLNTRPSTGEPEIDYLKLILNARVYDVANETPLTYASKLSTRLGNKIYLKREDLQPIFSFKCRGAYNKMYQLTPSERSRGVCAASAGNHAQGVALAANKLGIKATIVMPTFAPEIKVENVRRLGATVVLFGNDFDAAKKECTRLAIEKDLIFIPPFDDPYVIAGQGTVGVEILRQIKQDRLDAIFVCCGGGGLIAGIAAYVKRIRPEVQIIGVNTHDSDSMFKSLCAGKQTEIKEAGLFADGTSIRLPGAECVRLVKN